MGQATFLGNIISTDSYLTARGLSAPTIVSYPRTIGVLIQESGVIEHSLVLRSYMIGPSTSKRSKVELVMHELNEILGAYGTPIAGPNNTTIGYGGDLVVNGNIYHNAYAKTGVYAKEVLPDRIKYDIEFILGDQNTSASINQLPCVGLIGLNRGRKLIFTNKLEDGSIKNFTFWHNADMFPDYETYLVVKHSFSYGGHARIIKTGGFEKLTVSCWLANDDVPRQAIEAYAYNIINGPLGRLGTITLDNNVVYNNAFLTDFTMEDTPRSAIKYTLTFIISLQC